MKAFARVANFATVQLETGKGGWQFMQHQRAFEWQEESGSTLNHQQMPTPGRVPGTRQNICKFRPLSQIYEVRDHPLNSVPLTCICQDPWPRYCLFRLGVVSTLFGFWEKMAIRKNQQQTD